MSTIYFFSNNLLSYDRQIPLQSSYLHFNNQLLKAFRQMFRVWLFQCLAIVNFGIITTLQGNNNVAIEKKYKFVNSRKAQPLPSILPE